MTEKLPWQKPQLQLLDATATAAHDRHQVGGDDPFNLDGDGRFAGDTGPDPKKADPNDAHS